MYTYYIKHESEEHMLYAEEIAEYLGIMTETNRYHEKFVHAYLNEFINEYIENYTQLYFLNRYGGMKKVYHPVFIEAFQSLFKEHMKETDKIYSIKIKNKNYKVKRIGGNNYA